jgi:hypothetical protein
VQHVFKDIFARGPAARKWVSRFDLGHGCSEWLTATMPREPKLARRFLDRYEPVHGVTYFAPEVREALDGLGYKGYWMGYFAARSAPLGEVAPEVVTAIFYNFAPTRVGKALPAAWQIAGPEEALRVRRDTAVAVLRRYGLEEDQNLATAARLLSKVARNAPLCGRPLFAANSALPWPEDPLGALWHAATLLREHRGDTHTAVLIAAGVTGRECNVLHSASGAIPRDYIAVSRDYDDKEWALCEEQLGARGLLDEDGSLTAAGRELKEHIESSTDVLSLSLLDVLSDDEVETLFQALTPITRTVVAAGDVPAITPMALRRNELDDSSAHIGA